MEVRIQTSFASLNETELPTSPLYLRTTVIHCYYYICFNYSIGNFSMFYIEKTKIPKLGFLTLTFLQSHRVAISQWMCVWL